MTGDDRANRDDQKNRGGAGLTRREVLQVLAASAGAVAVTGSACADEAGTGRVGEAGPGTTSTSSPTTGTNPLAAGTPTDPDLLSPIVPWEGVLTEQELSKLSVLCDIIIPEDEHSPSASAIGAHDFIDEWVSAPYDGNREDLVLVRGGLVWLDIESGRRFDGFAFSELSLAQQQDICDDICWQETARDERRFAARFFDRVRDLTSTAFWTTEEGMRDLGFVGNRAMPGFEGPPPEVLRLLGLD